MLPLEMPENARVFYASLIALITFDPIPQTDYLYEKYYEMEKGDPYSDEAQTVGYGSTRMIFNSGSVYIFTTLMVAS